MPRNMPYRVQVEPGTYSWCSCGTSAKEPFCDGSHKDSGKEPVAFKVTKREQVGLCACGRTKTPSTCDGPHAR